MKDFCRISRYAGMREDLVQAGGGNSACKTSEDRMLIKASGYQLADVSETNGYAIVNPRLIRLAFLECDNIDDMTEKASKQLLNEAFISGERPSIETFLHSISGKYSLHTHPIVVNAITCQADGENVISKLFPDALIVPYETPGIKLAKVYFKAYKKYKVMHPQDPQVVFLMNHGLLVSADTADEVISLTEEVTSKIEAYLEVDFSSYHSASYISTIYKDGIVWKVTDKNVLDAYQRMGRIWDPCFCPDCVVFLGKKMYSINGSEIDWEDLKQFVLENGYPIIVAYRDSLYIHAVSVKKAMEIQSVLSFSAQVSLWNLGKQVNLLSESERNYLLNWDAEKYRKNIK